ncbi:DUF1178 family protein [Croceicoccus sp. F390]|uniref:DUF1178 family protein n=1 Tax=Croceicoccus esteveae TaxID=3075597 RepID=A0ABU2ZFU7_9SPHN|nr:DUF1178 family protein [Croceicoccus sp. F390]MDT0575471.1 DUF1178 family protein [Croceicoccus sp. F390]
MIVFDLSCCLCEHRFETWFRSSADFAQQQTRGLLLCPQCGNNNVQKAVMAPAVSRKGNSADPQRQTSDEPSPAMSGKQISAPAAPSPLPAEARKVLSAFVDMQREALSKSRWVGPAFADQARAMHYGEQEPELIHGQASAKQARELADEGVEVAPILFPLAPPDSVN